MTDLKNLKIGVIGIPGKWSTEVLADALEKKTGFRLVIDMKDVWADLDNQQLYYQDENLCQLDGLMVKKISAEYSPNTLDRLELLRMAEKAGVRVFSSALSMIRLIDRLSCTVTLRNHNIPQPPTHVTENPDIAFQTVQTFGSAVFKPLYSTKARGMLVLDREMPESSLKQRINDFHQENPSMYIQKKVPLPGQDLGMVFLGGKYLGTYARVSQSDAWNTTINSGGKYAPYEATPELIELAYNAQKPFSMDFTTVDVAETDQGPIVFEVSAFGGFAGTRDGIGIDAAGLYADYAIEQLSK